MVISRRYACLVIEPRLLVATQAQSESKVNGCRWRVQEEELQEGEAREDAVAKTLGNENSGETVPT